MLDTNTVYPPKMPKLPLEHGQAEPPLPDGGMEGGLIL